MRSFLRSEPSSSFSAGKLANGLLLIAVLIAASHLAAADSTSVSVTVGYFQCSDGSDNDSDALIDFGSDPGCSSAIDDDETDPPVAPPSSGGGGGGGGGGGSQRTTPEKATGQVVLRGKAYPGSRVTVLSGARVVFTAQAAPDATFEAVLSDIEPGTRLFSVYSEDAEGNRSSLLTFPIQATARASTRIDGIFIAPTIGADKRSVRQGETVTLSGQTAPLSTITIEVHSEKPTYALVTAGETGAYSYGLDTTPLEIGEHVAKASAAASGETSPFSRSITFMVGAESALAEPSVPAERGDANGDGRVDLTDFSITAYWYNKSSPPSEIDQNKDGKVNLVDFSILAYYWTG